MIRQVSKVCTKCGQEKGVEEFHFHKTGRDGRNSVCKNCRRAENAAWGRTPHGKQKRKEIREKVREIPDTKLCTFCNIQKGKDEFNFDKSMKDGLSGRCKSCKSLYHKEWYSNPKNRERRSELGALRYNEPERNQKIKEHRRSKRAEFNQRDKKRRGEDVQFRLSGNLRTRFNQAFRSGSKQGSAIRDLGCSIAYLKVYLESKFQKGMTWENYGNRRGNWNIDHIMPLSAFDLRDRQHVVLVCHYLNLQPLWHIENIKKRNKLGK